MKSSPDTAEVVLARRGHGHLKIHQMYQLSLFPIHALDSPF
jgi:hypothetical protein